MRSCRQRLTRSSAAQGGGVGQWRRGVSGYIHIGSGVIRGSHGKLGSAESHGDVQSVWKECGFAKYTRNTVLHNKGDIRIDSLYNIDGISFDDSGVTVKGHPHYALCKAWWKKNREGYISAYQK